MANLYGVANPVIYPATQSTIAFANIPCPAGSETNIVDSNAIYAVSAGFYYPVVWAGVCILYGASIPTSITINGRIGAGSDFMQYQVDVGAVAANAIVTYFPTLIGPMSQVTWLPPGVHIFVSLSPVGQPITAAQIGTYCTFSLFRAPDQ